MKASSIAALLAIATWRAAAQGTVNFANGAAGVNAPVKLTTVGEPPEGPRWRAELLLVTGGGGVQRIGEPVPLQTADLAGYFFGGLVTVPGIGAGARATFEVRVVDTDGTASAISNPVTVTLGGGKMPPPNLVGLESWSLKAATPELTITFFQKSVTLSWRTAFPNAVLEFTDSLTSPNWRAVSETPQSDGASLSVAVSVAASERYYRLRLE